MRVKKFLIFPKERDLPLCDVSCARSHASKNVSGRIIASQWEQAGPSVDLRKDFSKAAAFPVLERGQ